jgi:hypothetical protein
MVIKSHALLMEDFKSPWYKYWATQLKQDKDHLHGYALQANKFWQNAALCEALSERGALKAGSKGIGFGVGNERLPALFASMEVDITATDQDFRTTEAKHWAKGELATDIHELNQLGICSDKKFVEHLSYRPVDMRKVPKKLFNQYDFLWTNCAIGHLGSIEAGMHFVEDSLNCLKPGGVALHTTEVNVLSNSETVTSGSTVIFRLKDIYELSKRLSAKGYVCEPLIFDLGTTPADMRLSLRPQFGNDYSKIQVGGHLATQVILIIRKLHKPSASRRHAATRYLTYNRSLRAMRTFKNQNPSLQAWRKSQKTPLDALKITPVKERISLTIPKATIKDLVVEFKNELAVSLYGLGYSLNGTNPILLATTEPHDRASKFADSSWFGTGENRPSYDLRLPGKKGEYPLADSIAHKQTFGFFVKLNAQNVPPGSYHEALAIVQEHVGWIENTTVTLIIKVT